MGGKSVEPAPAPTNTPVPSGPASTSLDSHAVTGTPAELVSRKVKRRVKDRSAVIDLCQESDDEINQPSGPVNGDAM